jgi:hypothetical protein
MKEDQPITFEAPEHRVNEKAYYIHENEIIYGKIVSSHQIVSQSGRKNLYKFDVGTGDWIVENDVFKTFEDFTEKYRLKFFLTKQKEELD